jgi:hypothetical protein
MKTNNKEDIRLLKSKHRLELVMQETGENLEVDAAKSDLWRSKNTPGLSVNVTRQLYELARPGMDTESGDVIAWLQSRYGWSFRKAKTYLENRKTTNHEAALVVKVAKAEKNTKAKNKSNDYNYGGMDAWQEAALETAGAWVTKYFDKTSDEIWQTLIKMPNRFKQVCDFRIEKCAHCETPFNWQVFGTFAFAQEESEEIDIYFESDNEDLDLYVYIDEKVFIDVDFVICEKCARGFYAKRYRGLRLAFRSAIRREKAAAELVKEYKREAQAEMEAQERRLEQNQMAAERQARELSP